MSSRFELRARVLRLATAALLLFAFAASCTHHDKPQRIVVISLDTLRYDALAAMPLLRARAAKARVFERHYAATSCTQPTHATLLTGLAPWQHGVSRNGLVLGDDVKTLAERLHDAGWSTSAVVASIPLARVFGFAQGFDHYRDAFEKKMAFRTWDGVEVGDKPFYSLGTHVADEAVAALDEASGEHQFFFFHLFDAHAPYGDTGGDAKELWSPARILAELKNGADVPSSIRDARAAYDRDVAAMDGAVERVLARLERDAEEYDTHVVILADHGESFGEGGVLSHGSRITEEQIHVPLIVLSPRIQPGVETRAVGTLDVAATIVALAGLGPLPDGGRDLTATTIPPGAVFGMRRTYAEPYNDARSDGKVDVITGEDFYVVEGADVFTGDAKTVRKNDIEGSELDGEHAAKVGRLFGTFAEALSSRTNNAVMDPATKAALAELGYTGG